MTFDQAVRNQAMTLKEAAKRLRHVVLKTDGRGYWTNLVRNVRIQSAKVHQTEGIGFGTEEFLLVKFDPKTWDVEEHGLIYTDRTWLAGLRAALHVIGYERADEVNYTEQGMQGEKYVHLIVGRW